MKGLTNTLAILALVVGLTGCGDGGRTNQESVTRPVSDRQAIQQLYARYTSAIEAGHYRSLCRMSSKGFRNKLARMFHHQVTCEVALCQGTVGTAQ